MNDDEREGSAEPGPAEPRDKADLQKGVARFAQYTSPMMLAMLVSTSKNAAFAGS